MCFQNFVDFQCGCKRLDENKCDHANGLDLNFWRKIDCPNYTSEQHIRPNKCGLGLFYCGKTEDGQMFDAIDRLHSRASHQHSVMKSQAIKGKQIMAKVRDEWVASGRSVEELKASREAKVFWTSNMWIAGEWKMLEQHIQNWVAVKDLAKQYHDRQQQELELGAQAGPSFSSYLARTQAQAFAMIMAELNPDLTDVDEAYLDISQHWENTAIPQSDIELAQPQDLSSHHGLGGPRDTSRLSVWEGVYNGTQSLTPQSQRLKRYKQQSTDSLHAESLQAQQLAIQLRAQKLAVQSQLAHQQRLQAPAQYATPTAEEHPKKRGKPSRKQKKIEASVSPEKSSSIRRSSRVKDKQVNYAVDILSDVSRSPSPVKSDVSAFSPQKSDRSYTPVKPRASVKKETSTLHDSLLGRGKVNLAEQIGEWSQSDSAFSTPRPLDQHTGGRQRKVGQVVADVFDNITVKQEPMQKEVRSVNPTADSSGEQQPVWVTQPDGSLRLSSLSKPESAQEISKRPASAPTPPYSQYRKDGDGNAFPLATTVGAYSMPNPFMNSTMSQLHQGTHRAIPPLQHNGYSAGHNVPSTNSQVFHQNTGQSYEHNLTSGSVPPEVDTSATRAELPTVSTMPCDENMYFNDADWSMLDDDATV